jgi:hypothetical protein
MIAPLARRRDTGPSLEQVVVIALAADRLARAVSIDEVSRPLRDRIERWSSRATSPRGSHARTMVSDLVHCPVCVGWWTSLLMSAAWPGPMRARRGVAVAGAQVVLTLAARLVSEQGRVAIEHADLVSNQTSPDEASSDPPSDETPSGHLSTPGLVVTSSNVSEDQPATASA